MKQLNRGKSKYKKKKTWKHLLCLSCLFIIAGLVSLTLIIAVSHAGLGDSILFGIVWAGSYALVYDMGQRSNAMAFSHVMAIIITIIAFCMIWNTAFNYTE